MINSLNSKHLTEREITDLLRGPQKCLKEISDKVEVTERAALRDSLEKAVGVFKKENDFKNVELLSNLLCNFDDITFFVEFADENSIVYSFEWITNSAYYSMKDSIFFTLQK